jgi:hypothetical protein
VRREGGLWEGPDWFSEVVIGSVAVIMNGVPGKDKEVREARKREVNNGGVVLISGKLGVNAQGV